MNILGISAFHHDSAASLVCNGNIIAAAQEERFTRIKHDCNFPRKAISYCLQEGNLSVADVDYVIYYEKPMLKFDRLLETYLEFAPIGFSSFSKAIPLWIKKKLCTRGEIKKILSKDFSGKVLFSEHHESHAASAFFPSPFHDSAILTIDGVGEWTTASIGKGLENNISILKEMHFPHSLGLLYSSFTYFCGFKVNSGEYKLMGLAPYGKPRYVELIKNNIVNINEDGSIQLDLSYFNYCQGLTMTSKKFETLFKGRPRKPESDITDREMDLAASIQIIVEECTLRMAKYAKYLTGCKNLCLAGGVALNCVANGKLLDSGIFENIWIQPAAGDAGGSLGAALFVWYQLLENQRVIETSDSMRGALLGCKFSNFEIKKYLDDENIAYEYIESEPELIDRVANYISEKKVIGWFHGRMEFGPRSLGSRSIIGDARSTKMQSVMNLKIKYRESFRPFAPSVLREDCKKYFNNDHESPYMLLVASIQEKRRTKQNADEMDIMISDKNLCNRVNISRSEIPAITHIDYSARVQTVDKERHGRYYSLLKKFKEKTGCSVIVNTSFNIRGEPIVCTPQDAFRCFINTEMDVLVLENFIILKKEQKQSNNSDVEEYKKSFELD